MILIAISWIYILFTSINLGYILQRLLKLEFTEFVVTAILGLFSVSILASFWAFFGRINIEFHLFLLLLNILLGIGFRQPIASIYKSLTLQLQRLSSGLKVTLGVITVLLLAQCSAAPFIVDNESYYIQTVKWLNEYGMVKGLANLHFFFGQTSGWHVAQSAFSFSFLYSNFNDLSGFCLLLGNCIAFTKLHEYFSNRNFSFLIIGLLPLANVFFFRFIGAPAPDIAIYVISFIIFFYFLENYKNSTVASLNLVAVLVLFAAYIKPTSITSAILPLFLLLRNFRDNLRGSYRILVLSAVILVLFIGKSLVLTGYPLFPFPTRFFEYSPDFQVPEKIMRYLGGDKSEAFQLSLADYEAMPIHSVLFKWLLLPGLHGLFNKSAVFLVFISPIFILKYFNKREYWLLYLTMLLQLVILFALSPQYRFFMNFILFFTFLCLAPMFRNRMFVEALLYLSTFCTAVLLFIPLNYSKITGNDLAKTTHIIPPSAILFPLENSKSDNEFKAVTTGNLQYYSPLNTEFLWQTGNGPLPCVNKLQIDFFELYFAVTPQLRTGNISDGFYAKFTSDE
ncbi:MAG TPA: hypothetical protein VF581_03860 [Flavobacterium sp.]|jgi:hypothetical protein